MKTVHLKNCCQLSTTKKLTFKEKKKSLGKRKIKTVLVRIAPLTTDLNKRKLLKVAKSCCINLWILYIRKMNNNKINRLRVCIVNNINVHFT